MLDGTQREELCAALFSAFPTLPAFDFMLLSRVNQRRDRVSTAIGVGLPIVILEVIKAAEDEFWTPNLIAGACAAAGANPDIRALLAKYPELDPGAAPAQPVNHYDAHFLVGRRVFLCRPGLRGNLKRIGQGNETRVLVVTGQRGSGKTYSKDFIGYLLQFDPAYQAQRNQLAYADLDQFVDGLETLARRIGTALQLDPATLPPRPKDDKEQDSRWVPDLFNWLVKGVNAGNTDVWWLVLDGFRVQTLPQAGLDLIDQLADYADNVTTRLRLVLLNYPRADALQFSLREDIPGATLDRPDIEKFIQTIYDQSGKPADAQRVSQAVDEILVQVGAQVAKDPAQPYLQLRLLSLALTRAARQLLA